ncbi:MAG: AAA family ATPase, partial [Chitinophagales bacterium]
VRTLSEVMHLDFKRIQFTPDLMPSDIIGTEILEEDEMGKKQFRFIQGPVFTNILLADEINRTPPKTQAALLEAMQEFKVSYAGKSYPFKPPFFLLATQNPIEQAGTYPLPEAQLDRFLLYIKINYPTEAEELAILTQTTGAKKKGVQQLVTGETILQAQSLVREVYIDPNLVAYVNQLVRGTRPDSSPHAVIQEQVRWGAGPRAGQALILTAKARAFLKGRLAVVQADIDEMAFPVLRHRILVSFKAEAQQISSDDVVKSLLKIVKPNRIKP